MVLCAMSEEEGGFGVGVGKQVGQMRVDAVYGGRSGFRRDLGLQDREPIR